MTIVPRGYDTILLIGPCNTGKTTLGRMLAERLGCSFRSLDSHDAPYVEAAGFDREEFKRLRASGDYFAGYHYIRRFYDSAVVGFLADFSEGVLEFGGGHPVVPEPEKQERINAALQPYRNVILILPVPDYWESVKILKERVGKKVGDPDLNDFYDDRFYRLAKHVVYTQDKTPEDTCREIIEWLKATGG